MKSYSVAERSDRHMQWFATAMFVVSLMYIASALEFILPTYKSTLSVLQVVCAVSTVIIVLPIMYWKLFKLSKRDRTEYFQPDGFLFGVVKKAASKSWAITFVVVVLAIPLIKRLEALPPKFFLELTVALMVGTFGVLFFFYQSDQGSSTPEEL